MHRPTKCFTEQNVCFIIILSLLSAEVIGGILVDEKEIYRERIIEMVKKVENNDMLKFLYIVVSDLRGIIDNEQDKN